MSNNSFFNFLKQIKFDVNQTRIEKFRLDGTSNYLISLNYSGITWAVAIRLPAIGIEYSKFEEEKLRAVGVAKFLAEYFGEGIPLSANVSFLFDGNSSLMSYDAVMEYFSFQNSLQPLLERENITAEKKEKKIESLSYPEGIDNDKKLGVEKREQVKQYLSDYRGSFFVSKGAPASETLDDYWDMIFDVSHALAILHTKSGLHSVVPMDVAIELAVKFDDELTDLSLKTTLLEGSSAYESFQKHQKKRNPGNDLRVSKLIQKEIVLRTKPGKELLSRIVAQFEDKLRADKSFYSSFTHNDPHCENFVIVKYLYDIRQSNHQYMDREFLNDIIERRHVSSNEGMISIVYNEQENSLSYRNFQASDMGADNINVVSPRERYDIHLIDIDEASGITEKDRRLHIYDLLIYAQSVQNISSIKGHCIPLIDIITAYYKNIEKYL